MDTDRTWSFEQGSGYTVVLSRRLSKGPESGLISYDYTISIQYNASPALPDVSGVTMIMEDQVTTMDDYMKDQAQLRFREYIGGNQS